LVSGDSDPAEVLSREGQIKEIGGGKKASATIYDIAKIAGVNASTVSRALNKPGRVSAKTQKLVEDAVEELNFRANPFARALPTGRTNNLGLIVADITNPSFFDLIRGAGKGSALQDFTLVLAESAESGVAELTAARRMLGTVDGLILASPRMDDKDIRSLARHKHVVVINREVDGVPCVIPDASKGIGQAVRSLAANGHRKLAFVAGPPRSWMSDRRWEGIQAACEWSRLAATRLESTTPTLEGGRKVARAVRESGATAVMTYNDLLAIGLMQELQVAGIEVPDALSIVGFDDIFGADFTTPSLTTIRSPLGECGSLATRLMLDLLDGSQGETCTLHAETELVLRGSSGRLLSA
jgi:LacI family transcriptional regulator, repressor for deo operon, udp, cdd, tsx, nupC, and nupG